MAGVKGRSGGARPGAGRKKKPPATETQPESPGQKPEGLPGSAADFLRMVMAGRIVPSVPQLEAAKLLARLEVAPKGKKEAANEAAGKVAAGKFGARPAPLKLVGGG